MEAVQLLKNRIEAEAAQKHAKALVSVGKARSELSETERELNAAALMQFSSKKNTSAQELVQLNQYIAALEKMRRERLERCLVAEKEATLARAAVEKAAREREILDRVHEHQRKTHRFHVARQEQKWMDDLAQQMKRGIFAGRVAV
jgi:flagellar export protein FliJ